MVRLAGEYPGTAKDLCALDHRNPYELLVATILSAQCTDERVNMVTPTLFARYPTPRALAAADPRELETLIHSTGFFRQKAKSLLGVAAATADQFGGELPREIDTLVTLPGIGRKTAERLVLELKDKVELIAITNASARSEASGDVLNALLALGYNDKEANWAVQQLQGTTAVTEGIRQALKLLSKS